MRIVGIDPASAANAPFRDGLVSGEWLTADDREGVLIGQPLADKLGLAPGDQINLLVNTSRRRRGRAALHHPRHLHHAHARL